MPYSVPYETATMVFPRSILLGLWLFLLISAPAQFIPPAEGPVPFRRDRLPIEAREIAHLSRVIEELAREIPVTEPAGRRGRAKCLALALALDPQSEVSIKHLKTLVRGESQPASHPERAGKNRAFVKALLPWLKSAEAGNDAAILADCLQDVLAVLDARETPGSKPESPVWKNWVPDIGAYRPSPADPPKETSSPEAEPVKETLPRLAEATLRGAFWQSADDQRSEERKGPVIISQLEMKAKPSGKSSPHGLWIGRGESEERYRGVARLVSALLKKRHGGAISQIELRISGAPLEIAQRQQSVAPLCFVLADSAFSGIAPTGAVVGDLKANGTYKNPASIWPLLKEFEANPADRLVVPSTAAEILPAFLALEKPGYFLENEVLIAESPEQLIHLSSSGPPAAIAATLQKFAEVRTHAGGLDVRIYIGNRFVRQRLEAIVQEAPWHFSARMLLLQSTGNRPTTIPSAVLAAELLEATAPARWLAREDPPEWNEVTLAKLEPTYDACRTKIDAIERYANRENIDLIQSTRDMVAEVRTLAKTAKSRGEEWEVREELRNASEAFSLSFKEQINRLNQAVHLNGEEKE